MASVAANPVVERTSRLRIRIARRRVPRDEERGVGGVAEEFQRLLGDAGLDFDDGGVGAVDELFAVDREPSEVLLHVFVASQRVGKFRRELEERRELLHDFLRGLVLFRFFPGGVASEVIHVRLHQILRPEHRGVVLERALDERPELKVDGRPVRRRAQ